MGAGYLVSETSGDIATFTKLLRVAMLLPFVFTLTIIFRSQNSGTTGKRPPVLPRFLVAFAILVVLNSMGLFSGVVVSTAGVLSSRCLVIVIAALGMKTSFKALADIRVKAVGLVVAETIFIAVVGLSMVWWPKSLLNF